MYFCASVGYLLKLAAKFLVVKTRSEYYHFLFFIDQIAKIIQGLF